jgi:hypothetical protein
MSVYLYLSVHLCVCLSLCLMSDVFTPLYRGQNANHFSPSAVLFTPEQYWQIVQSDIAFFAAAALLCYAIYTFGELIMTG